MLLRASSRAAGEEAVDVAAAVGRDGSGGDGPDGDGPDGTGVPDGDGPDGTGVPDGALLVDFAEAVCRRRDDVSAVRSALLERVGAGGLVEAAATVAIFNGLVRVADGTGIPLDDGAIAESADFRGPLGLDAYSGAVNTDADRGDPTRLDGTVEALFR